MDPFAARSCGTSGPDTETSFLPEFEPCQCRSSIRVQRQDDGEGDEIPQMVRFTLSPGSRASRAGVDVPVLGEALPRLSVGAAAVPGPSPECDRMLERCYRYAGRSNSGSSPVLTFGTRSERLEVRYEEFRRAV